VWLPFAPACLEELPAATDCPAAAQVKGGDCTPVLSNPPLGCFGPAEVACLAGNITTCNCQSDACPTPDDACYPDGDCPELVKDEASKTADCRRLDKARFGLQSVPNQAVCLCGCAGCASVCDGVGPVMGINAVVPLNTGPIGLVVDVADKMPDSGTLGAYLRLRGTAAVVVAVATGSSDVAQATWIPDLAYLVVTTTESDFVERVLYNNDYGGRGAYVWQRPEDKPTLLAIYPPGSAVDGGAQLSALFEVDCVVPFSTRAPAP
jgi:hypothetical protein